MGGPQLQGVVAADAVEGEAAVDEDGGRLRCRLPELAHRVFPRVRGSIDTDARRVRLRLDPQRPGLQRPSAGPMSLGRRIGLARFGDEEGRLRACVVRGAVDRDDIVVQGPDREGEARLRTGFVCSHCEHLSS